MRLILINILFAYSFCIPVLAGNVEHEIIITVQRLKTTVGNGWETRANRKEIRESFRKAANLMTEILNSPDIRDDDELEHVRRLALPMAGEFGRIARDFLDPSSARSGLRGPDPVLQPNPFLRWGAKGLGVVSYFFSGLARDLGSIIGRRDGRFQFPPPGWLLIGRDASLSRFAAGIMKDISKAFDDEFERHKDQEGEKAQAVAGLRQVLDFMLSVEPVQYGPHHRWMMRAYLFMGIYFGLNPIEFWQRTEYGPLVFGSILFLSGGFMRAVRANNSGLRAFKIFQRMRKAAGLPKLKRGDVENCSDSLHSIQWSSQSIAASKP